MFFYGIICRNLLIIFIALDKKTTSKSDCGNVEETNSEGGCCSNFHMVDGVCKACDMGYFGNNCGVPCVYPAFGQFCMETCNCGQSECNHVYGCKRDETTTITLLSSSFIDTSVSKAVGTSLITPITAASDMRETAHKETLQSDDKFTVVLSVTAVSSVIIILSIVISKLRCGTKDTIIYYINRSKRHRPVSFHDQFQVPFRNLETDIYMEIEEMEEVDDISIESFGNFQNGKREENEGLKFDPLTKPKPDSLQTGEKASFKTNVDNVLKPKPDTLKHKEKSFKKFEKYKTFTTRRFTNSKVHLKRYNSWHNVIEVPITLQSIRRTRSVLNISDEKFKHCILKM